MSNFRETILESLFVLLRPLARALIKNGLGYREFTDVARMAFVASASEEFGIRGRPTNTSRVALITGLSRRVVVHTLEQLEEGNHADIDASRSPSKVIQEWKNNRKFLTKNGIPEKLPFAGEVSFSNLVRLAGGDVPPGAVRTELIRVGCVRQLDDDRLELIGDLYIDADDGARLAMGLRNQLALHAETIFHNSSEDGSSRKRFERILYSHNLRPKDMEAFERVVTAQLHSFVSKISSNVDYYEKLIGTEQGLTDSESRTAGIGLYYFERE